MALALGGFAYRYGHRATVPLCLAGLPAALVAYALAPSLGLAAGAIFLVGALYLGCLSSFTTIAQLRAPAEMRGRVLSALMVLLGLLYPIGSVVQGALADEVGLRVTTAAAALLLAASFAVVRVWRPVFDRDLGDAAGPAADLGSTTLAPADQ
jgi:predicted MFS family arabinose efflux permease